MDLDLNKELESGRAGKNQCDSEVEQFSAIAVVLSYCVVVRRMLSISFPKPGTGLPSPKSFVLRVLRVLSEEGKGYESLSIDRS